LGARVHLHVHVHALFVFAAVIGAVFHVSVFRGVVGFGVVGQNRIEHGVVVGFAAVLVPAGLLPVTVPPVSPVSCLPKPEPSVFCLSSVSTVTLLVLPLGVLVFISA
jgi:hypothetical protein